MTVRHYEDDSASWAEAITDAGTKPYPPTNTKNDPDAEFEYEGEDDE